MKKMQCEMCGSNNLVKQGGLFVCQNCDCKYSVEEAKKMMVEGEVKIDKSKEFENLLELSINSFFDKRYQDAFDQTVSALKIEKENPMAMFINGLSNYATTSKIEIEFSPSATKYFDKSLEIYEDIISKIEDERVDIEDREYGEEEIELVQYLEDVQHLEDNINQHLEIIKIMLDGIDAIKEKTKNEIERIEANAEEQGRYRMELYKGMDSEYFQIEADMFDTLRRCRDATYAIESLFRDLREKFEALEYSICYELDCLKSIKRSIYWEKHPDEYTQLHLAKKQNSDDIKKIDDDIKSENLKIADMTQTISLEISTYKDSLNEKNNKLLEEMSSINARKNSLSVFKNKERKHCDSLIQELNTKLLSESQIEEMVSNFKKTQDEKIRIFEVEIEELNKRKKELIQAKIQLNIQLEAGI